MKIKTLQLPSGRPIPALGQGTWAMAEQRSKRPAEIEALRLGLDLGLTLIDTAEMYGEGAAEELVAEAIGGRRAEVFLVSKVYPHNATRQGAVVACERSLRRLNTDHLDLYLLHWRENTPLSETLEAFQSLRRSGKILDYGVSNFDVNDMVEAAALPGGAQIAANQVLYNLAHRGVESGVLPWCRERGIPIMAYTPIDLSPNHPGHLLRNPRLQSVASRLGATPAQVALAWLLQQGTIPIPKAASADHVRENRAALDLVLSGGDLEELDAAFPPPAAKVPLEMR